MIPKIKKVQVRPDYKLKVDFKGKGSRLFDMKPYLSKGIFKELANPRYFQKVRVVWGGVEWPNQQDLSSDTLYSLGEPVSGTNKSMQRTPLTRRR